MGGRAEPVNIGRVIRFRPGGGCLSETQISVVPRTQLVLPTRRAGDPTRRDDLFSTSESYWSCVRTSIAMDRIEPIFNLSDAVMQPAPGYIGEETLTVA